MTRRLQTALEALYRLPEAERERLVDHLLEEVQESQKAAWRKKEATDIYF